jgi:hypothetical protein
MALLNGWTDHEISVRNAGKSWKVNYRTGRFPPVTASGVTPVPDNRDSSFERGGSYDQNEGEGRTAAWRFA